MAGVFPNPDGDNLGGSEACGGGGGGGEKEDMFMSLFEIPKKKVGMRPLSPDTDSVEEELLDDNSRESTEDEEKVLVLRDDEKLVNLFPNLERDELLHLFQMCNGDLNETISMLLDSGYSMTGDMEKRRNSESDPIDMKTLRIDSSDYSYPPKIMPYRSDSSFDQDNLCSPTSSVTAITTLEDNRERESGDLSLSASSSDSLSVEERERYKALGARPKVRFTQPEVSCSNTKSPTRTVSNDLLIPVDGEDWVDLEIPIEFAEVLSTLYGHPQGKPVANLSEEERKIRLPPTMAFDLFRYLSLNVLRSETAAQEKSSLERIDMDEDECEDGEMTEIMESIRLMTLETSQKIPNFASIVEIEQKLSSQELSRMERLKNLKRSMAQNVKFSQLKLAFPGLSPGTVDDIFVQSVFDYDKAYDTLKSLYPSKHTDKVIIKQEEPPVAISQFPQGNEVSYDPEIVAKMAPGDKKEMVEMSRRWKAHYESLRESYYGYRAQCEVHRSQPEVFSYYMYKLAETKTNMQNTLRESWFYTVISLNAGNRDPNKIDLHGLSVQNAIEVVSKFLRNREIWYKNSGLSEQISLNIITGIGKHSLDNIPRINPAVRNFLRSNHYSYSDQHGNFIVHLHKSKTRSK